MVIGLVKGAWALQCLWSRLGHFADCQSLLKNIVGHILLLQAHDLTGRSLHSQTSISPVSASVYTPGLGNMLGACAMSDIFSVFAILCKLAHQISGDGLAPDGEGKRKRVGGVVHCCFQMRLSMLQPLMSLVLKTSPGLSAANISIC